MSTEQLTDHQKAFLLSIALGACETVKVNEVPGSVRCRRMEAAIKEICRIIDIYRPEAWAFEPMNQATALLDEINDRIKEMFQ